MGPITATVYAALMAWGYGKQIYQLWTTGRTEGIAMQFFTITWIAVAVRLSTVGMLILETRSVTAVALAIADSVVFFGLLAIAASVWWLRRKQTRHRQPI